MGELLSIPKFKGPVTQKPKSALKGHPVRTVAFREKCILIVNLRSVWNGMGWSHSVTFQDLDF